MQWVKKIKYYYVPAIRGVEYFNHLMGELHDALSEINPNSFSAVSNKFVDGLKTQVEILVENIAKELGYSSQISMPSNFKLLFSTLDFSLEKGGATISLNKRGDGIKAQHIPIILKFIASHYKSITGKAIISPDTIWGFEEPENNMEMGNAFKLAKIFASFSEDLQIFINTHSPSFYSLAKDNPQKTNLFLVKCEDEKSGTKLFNIEKEDTEVFDREVGILPLITEHIKKEVELKIAAEKQIEQFNLLISKTKFLIFTEDQDTILCRKIFEMQGFDMDITEIISYESRSNLLAAMQSCKIKLTGKPDLDKIIFHLDRDSDVYKEDENELNKIHKRLENLNSSGTIKHFLFKTDLYDLESYFLNVDHILALYPKCNSSDVENFISEATIETKDFSLDKLYVKIEKDRKEAERNNDKNYSYSKSIKQIEEAYDKNPERYRYGKKVFGFLVAKLQKHLGHNVDLIQVTDKIKIPYLIKLNQ